MTLGLQHSCVGASMKIWMALKIHSSPHQKLIVTSHIFKLEEGTISEQPLDVRAISAFGEAILHRNVDVLRMVLTQSQPSAGPFHSSDSFTDP